VLFRSDFGPTASAWLAANRIKDITIVGRSAAAAAKFDPVMVKELGKLQGVTISVKGAGQSDDPVEAKKLAALAEIDGVAQGPLGIRFRFGLTPQRINAEAGRISSITFASASGEEETLPASALLTAIGFHDQGTLARDRLIAEAEDAEAGVLAQGLYATGWFRRGPQGTIPQNRSDARDLAARILADLAVMPDGAERPGAAAITGGIETVSYDQWKCIDAAELAAADSNRCRVKLATRQEMLRLARQHEGE
jgi:ferredoxin--NADP+ reductase